MLLANVLSLQFFEICIKKPYEQTVHNSFFKSDIILGDFGLFHNAKILNSSVFGHCCRITLSY